jgi:hypothetical protein
MEVCKISCRALTLPTTKNWYRHIRSDLHIPPARGSLPPVATTRWAAVNRVHGTFGVHGNGHRSIQRDRQRAAIDGEQGLAIHPHGTIEQLTNVTMRNTALELNRVNMNITGVVYWSWTHGALPCSARVIHRLPVISSKKKEGRALLPLDYGELGRDSLASGGEKQWMEQAKLINVSSRLPYPVDPKSNVAARPQPCVVVRYL